MGVCNGSLGQHVSGCNRKVRRVVARQAAGEIGSSRLQFTGFQDIRFRLDIPLGQRVFGQPFTEFSRRMAADYRMQNGQIHIKRHAAAFARAEKEFGVPPAVIAAFWALESDFGAQMGNLPTLPSLVSLAYDCRRSKMFLDEPVARR